MSDIERGGTSGEQSRAEQHKVRQTHQGSQALGSCEGKEMERDAENGQRGRHEKLEEKRRLDGSCPDAEDSGDGVAEGGGKRGTDKLWEQRRVVTRGSLPLPELRRKDSNAVIGLERLNVFNCKV